MKRTIRIGTTADFQFGLQTSQLLALGIAFLAAACWLGGSLPAHAEVVLQDQFNDADRDNDGTTDDGNATIVGTHDGIKWLAIGGQTSIGVTRPGLTIADDGIEGGIGSGNSLNVNTLGANNEFMGVFPETLTLGATVGSQLIVSFDIRVLDSLLPNTLQSFRFGIYQDSDSELGTASVNADLTPTTWGVTDGWFDGANSNSPVGTLNDFGVHARVKLGTAAPTDSDWRLFEELNTAPQVLGGTGDLDEIARPADFEAMDAGSLNDNEPHHITLTISRVVANDSGNTIRHDLDIDGLSFGGQDVNGAGTVNFESRDNFDYFVASMTFGIVNYRMDNFQVESILGVDTGTPGDFDDDGDVDGRDFLAWQRGDSPDPLSAGDLTLWQINYGPGELSTLSANTVPEPSCFLLAMVGGLLLGNNRRRSR